MADISLFGFQILKSKKQQQQPQSVVSPSSDDGSLVVSSSAAAYYSAVIDLDTTVKNENEMIRRYREVALHPECDAAIEEIVNEAICTDSNGSVVSLNLEQLKVSDAVKKKIQNEFGELKAITDFDVRAHDLFRNWYIDGRQYHIITVDPSRPKDGILKVDYVDSRKIRKIKKIEKTRDPKTGVDVVKGVEEYYVYNEKGVETNSSQGIKLSVDSVVYIPSGLFDQNSNLMLSYLHKTIKPVNNLKMLEDAIVINTVARAPERRIFYIDVGNMPKVKAEQYVSDIMNKYRNKITYNATTGEVMDSRQHNSLLEDYWMPRREGGKGTEITTLQGSGQLLDNDMITYFQQKLYQSLNVPVARLQPQQNFSLGRSNEITRDELKFNKFVSRLRNRFSQLLVELLRVQLIAKNVVSVDDWRELEKQISVEFVNDNNFVEMRDSELWMNRFQMLNQVAPFVGTYVSPEWVKREILKLTEEQIKELEKETEKVDPKFLPPEQQPDANQ